jgi:hypothetical protein
MCGTPVDPLDAYMKIYAGYMIPMSRDSAVGIATGYGLDDREVGVRVPVGSRISPSPHRPDRLWGPPSLLSNGHNPLPYMIPIIVTKNRI